MIPGYNDSTVPTNYDPFEVRYDNRRYLDTGSTLTANNYDWGTQSTATTTNWVEVYIPVAPRTEQDEKEDLKAFRKAVARSILLADQRALRTLRDDPNPKIPLQARKGLNGRQAVRKRVCAGSSRYRVLVN